jgi:hypothetical protein
VCVYMLDSRSKCSSSCKVWSIMKYFPRDVPPSIYLIRSTSLFRPTLPHPAIDIIRPPFTALAMFKRHLGPQATHRASQSGNNSARKLGTPAGLTRALR